MSYFSKSSVTAVSYRQVILQGSLSWFVTQAFQKISLIFIQVTLVSSSLLLFACTQPTGDIPQKLSAINSDASQNTIKTNKAIANGLCKSTVTAEVVALEQIITFNRFGAFNPAGMVYALRSDVVYDDPKTEVEEKLPLPEASKLNDPVFAKGIAGRISLKSDKRPRPLVLRVHEDECLQVKFWNLLSPLPTQHNTFRRADFLGGKDDKGVMLPDGGVQRHAVQETKPGDNLAKDISTPPRCFDKDGNADPNNNAESCKNLFPLPAQEEPDYPTTRAASIHVNGLEYVSTIPESCNHKDANGILPLGCSNTEMGSDGANVGKNVSSLVEPGHHTTYKWYARQEGGYFFYSAGALAGGEGDGGQLGLGLFGSVNVEPKGSVWYRSQVIHCDLVKAAGGQCDDKKIDQINDYSHVNYSDLAIVKDGLIQYSDLNAIIYQTNDTNETQHICSKRSPGSSCGMSFREFTTIFHDENKVFQAFAELADENNPISAIGDGMAINYGSSGVGSVVLANMKKIGPGKDCPDCKVEEFFLSSWVNGDPAMIVKRNMQGEAVEAMYPDDPSNVHHSYLGDPVRFRNIHAGPKETHVFHLHAHQWLQDKNDPNANYLDSQTISPGSSYTYDIQYGGGGNRNLTVGDAIFHCHLYPHFAAGMWELWRNHDVFEDGKPGVFNKDTNPRGRSLPDHELTKLGSPNPAIVPIPNYPLAPLPSKEFPGYPFYIAADPGHRPPQPPMDMALKDPNHPEAGWLNGGLPRHVVTGGKLKEMPTDLDKKQEAITEILQGKGDPIANKASRYVAQRTWQLNSDPSNLLLAEELESASLKILPQCGTKAEVLAMAFHAGWNKETVLGLKQGRQPDGMNIKVWQACQKDFKKVLADFSDTDVWTFLPKDTKWPYHRPIHNDTNPNPQQSTTFMSALWEGKGYENTKAAIPKDQNGKEYSPSEEVNPGNRFRINGYSPAQGAPFADPCPEKYFEGKTNNNNPFLVNRDNPRLYKAAYIQFDMTVNKYGWHDPQARMPVLEEDVAATLSGDRLPEPLFFRANSGDCIQFQATNLIPSVLNLDDFQVYTPTDTIGQHIHLVKFDVTSSDGSANGWNYEDGTFSPDEVRERINASHHLSGGIFDESKNIVVPSTLKAETHPMFKAGGSIAKSKTTDAKDAKRLSELGICHYPDPNNKEIKESPWCGAQTTVQRWWADPVLNHLWEDHTLRAVFTHDHYGPSSHQQHGFYGALIVEPRDSVWAQLNTSSETVQIKSVAVAPGDTSKGNIKYIDNCDAGFSSAIKVNKDGTVMKGKIFGGGADGKPLVCGNPKNPGKNRQDGGPTSYAANIGFADSNTNTSKKDQVRREYNLAFADFAILYNADLRPVNPPSRQTELMLPHNVRDGLKPKPESISTEDPGTRLVNYRNEPIPLRIAEEDKNSLEYHQKIECKDFSVDPPQPKNCDDLGNPEKKIVANTSATGDMANVFSSVIHDQSGKALQDGATRIKTLEKYVPHEITNRDTLISLLDDQKQKTNTFKQRLHENEPWRHPGDPSTPILAAYEGDPIQLHLIQGAQEEQHVFSMNGISWLAEPKSPNSSYMNGQQIGISEHFEFNTVVTVAQSLLTDYWYGSPAVENMWDGMWGILRGIGWENKNGEFIPAKKEYLAPLPKPAVEEPPLFSRDASFLTCPSNEIMQKFNIQKKTYYVTAWQASEIKELVFNNNQNYKISDPNAIVFFEVPESAALGLDAYEVQLMPVDIKPTEKNDTNKKDNNLITVTRTNLDLQINLVIHSKLSSIKVIYEKIKKDEKLVTAWVELNKHLDEVGDQPARQNKHIIVKNALILAGRNANWLQGNEVLKYLQQHKTSIDPMVLRANAGDCVQIEFMNYLPQTVEEMDSEHKHVTASSQSYNLMPPIVNGFNFNQVQMSNYIGLAPQLVAENTFGSQGANVGLNHWNCAFPSAEDKLDCLEGGDSYKKDMRNYRKHLTQACLLAANHPDRFSICNNITINADDPNPKNHRASYTWYMGSHKVINPAYETANACGEEDDAKCIDEPIKNNVKDKDGKPVKDANGQDTLVTTGYIRYTPMEFGAVSIRSLGDVIKHSSHSLVGALVVEPKGAIYCKPDQICDSADKGVKSYDLSTEAGIFVPASKGKPCKEDDREDHPEACKKFREFVLVVQDDLSLQQYGQPMPNHRMADDAEDTGQKGFNFRSEPLWLRNGIGTSGADFNTLNRVDYTNTLSSLAPNPGCQGPCGDPPVVFHAKKGESIRFRIVHPGGHSRQHALAVYGHNWDYQPWINDSTQLYDNTNNPDEEKKLMASRLGAIGGIGPGRHVNVLTKAGGAFEVSGDYLFRVQEQFQFQGGLWGILRVHE